MREIKFRAWNHDSNHWVPMFHISHVGTMHDSRFDCRIDYDAQKHILMQYTGLKDKNGVEIYEGDIIKTNAPNWKYEVIWQNGSFWLKHMISKKFTGSKVNIRRVREFEVIGNIYENPESLKGTTHVKQ